MSPFAKHITFLECPLPSQLRQAPLVGTREEEHEMSKAQTLTKSTPDAGLGRTLPFPALPTGAPAHGGQ